MSGCRLRAAAAARRAGRWRRELGVERVGRLIQQARLLDEDGQSLERGEVCTGTGSAIVSGRSKQAGAPSVSAWKHWGSRCRTAAAGEDQLASPSKKRREVCSESYAPGEPKEWTGWRSGKCLCGEGHENNGPVTARTKAVCLLDEKQAGLSTKLRPRAERAPGGPE